MLGPMPSTLCALFPLIFQPVLYDSHISPLYIRENRDFRFLSGSRVLCAQHLDFQLYFQGPHWRTVNFTLRSFTFLISDAWRSRLWSLSYNSFNFTPARIPWPVGAGEAEELGVRCAQQRDSDSFHRYTTQGSVCIPFFPVTHCLRMPQEVTEMVPLKAG